MLLQSNTNKDVSPVQNTGRQPDNFNAPANRERRIIHYCDIAPIIWGSEHMCFENAFEYVMQTDGGMRYIEGYIFDIGWNQMFHHAWGVDQSQRLNYEVTPVDLNRLLYFGFIVNRRDLKRHWTPQRKRNSFFSTAELKPIENRIRSQYPGAWIPPIPKFPDIL